MNAEHLHRLDLFSGLSKHELKELAQLVDEVDVPAGKVLGRKGEIAYEFFVIEEGTASVELDGEHIVDLGPGQWFGEIGLLAADRRTATVTAKTPMKLAVVFGPNFRDLTRRLPEVGERIRAEIAERLERAS